MSDISVPRLQHIIASGAVAAVGAWVTYVSYTQQPAEAFLFPRLISTVFVVLALWTFAKACLGWTKVGSGLSGRQFANMLPGLAVALIYIFWATKGLGFYTATAIAFFILLSLYDPASHRELRSWVKRVIITAIFLAVMYGLFALLLKVYTPREIFF
ncbi:tripartite tricarboxylate transporter TctB family protein [Sulfitobacter aestuariivivens]|uniref:Tripartite tricarboxylate transporter TctB family protein n=1 Tax=Sulfitobacter aestuariivivens TaxID=2766981 RepID=A0A927D670_9RHOB|nr:tripartite tricarboxylate transporter TctB family protein [Sulfitobacter aestuariivivens]MBD3665136.1 tripartite tricarboxylate transporter TctB family protein [Sulfitobacter aestuariivivens]